MSNDGSQIKNCARCGRPIGSGRKGTITAWIYTDTRCACEDGGIALAASSAASNSAIGNAEQHEHMPARTLPGAPNLGNKYQVLDFIGEGGMGSVYKVRDVDTGKIYAAKVLKNDLAGDVDAMKRFEREVFATSKLVHPNVLYIHGAFHTPDGTAFMVMNFVDGQSLTEMMRFHGTLAPKQAVHIFKQVAEALVYVHKKNIVHRDLKPSNILIYQDPSYPDAVRLVDFGIAKMIDTSASLSLTRTGQVFGSPFYMSPEQCNGESPDPRSDIYSLGCVMYEALGGRPPFEDDDAMSVLVSHINDIPKPLRTLTGARVSKDLEKVVMRCLEKNPERRYRSAEVLLRDLEAISIGAPIAKHADVGNQSSLLKFSPTGFEEDDAIERPAVRETSKAVQILLFSLGCFFAGIIVTLAIIGWSQF